VAGRPEGERLQKVLAHAGLGSRRAVEELIAAGRVKVNGRPARLGARVDPSKDEVEVDGSRVPLEQDLVHYVLNKPAGVVSTAADPGGRPTVVELLDVPARVWPVGRLDTDSEGLLIVTNDGDLTHRLTHPSYEVPKTYLAEVAGTIGRAAIRELIRGVELEDGITKRAQVGVVEATRGGTLLEITISEGRNRQVRRMCEAVGHPVKRLVRTRLGPLHLGRLKPGTFRKLSLEEVRALYRACGL
jgi:23S rRNA pseudouridine2605 synthase